MRFESLILAAALLITTALHTYAEPSASATQSQAITTRKQIVQPQQSNPQSQIAKANAKWGKLTAQGPNKWISAQGLIYDQGSRDGNRLAHVLRHAKPDPTKPVHSVYNVPENQVTAVIDEAWSRRRLVRPDRQPNGNDVYDIPMNRTIGTKGERAVRIVVETGTSRIITAFPIKNRTF